MTDQWCVLVNTGTDFYVYGPMEAAVAQGFAAFMTDTVDPATPRKLHSPTAEMLAWYRSEAEAERDHLRARIAELETANANLIKNVETLADEGIHAGTQCTHKADCPVHPLYCPPVEGCTSGADCPVHLDASGAHGREVKPL